MKINTDAEFVQQIPILMSKIKEAKPLVHHITNFVVMNDTANLTLTYGALPVMAHALEEVEEMVSLASVLLLNPGTLSPRWVESMLKAGRKANELGIPIILDPVGAGATKFRTDSNLRLLEELKISVIRGNPGEISALMGNSGLVKGVESVGEVDNLKDSIKEFSQKCGAVIAVTGKRDYVTDGTRVIGIDNGHSMLRTLTGTGCMSTTAIASFCAITNDYLLGTIAGLTTFAIASELAAARSEGPMSFKVALFDSLYNLTSNDLVNLSKIFLLE